MQKAASLWDSVGSTPLIRIRSLSELSGCEVYGKAEYLNPGGSVKDRAARGIIAAAEQAGHLGPGAVIVEGTAGNTGIGLATLAMERGYKVIVSMPNNQAAEKYSLLTAIGADVRQFAPCPFKDPNHFYHQAKKIAAETPQAYWADQFENVANAEAHYQTTAPEIFQQLDSRLDAFVSAVGTGGTFGGISAWLKEQVKSIQTIVADPDGSGVYSFIKDGEFKGPGSSITEGIGIMRQTANFARGQADDALKISDQQMINMLFHVARKDGLFVGTSSAINLYGAWQWAMRPENKDSGKRVVTILCDHGSRYTSKLLNPEWLRERELEPAALV
ncbi:MAG: cysteine synthase A [Leptospiraceae bacterium]|nr:cysteine synthase A [Leptospiraceae bacterium]